MHMTAKLWQIVVKKHDKKERCSKIKSNAVFRMQIAEFSRKKILLLAVGARFLLLLRVYTIYDRQVPQKNIEDDFLEITQKTKVYCHVN